MTPMQPEIRLKLRESLIKDEEYTNFPYVDVVGKITIGAGYNLTDRGLPDRYLLELLNEDMDFHYKKLNECYVWFASLTDNRKVSLLNMCYNLGWRKFLSFNKMLSAISKRDYELAAREMLDSRWAQQVGDRAIRLANLMEEG